jgi:hypothetical protein
MKIRNAFIAWLALCAPAFAAIVDVNPIVNFDGGSMDRVVIMNNTPLVSGFAGSGYFSITDAQVDALISANDYATLVSAFSATIGTDDFMTGYPNLLGISAIPGLFAINNSSITPGATIGQTIYTFFGDGTTLAGSANVGLFAHGTTLTADPAPPGLPNSYALNLADGVVKIGGIQGAPLMVNVDFRELGLGVLPVQAAMQMVPVPEPSAALLIAMGSLGLLRRRRI